jgi:death on curing protein
MTVEPRWISKRALLLLHEESLGTFGGARGVRDEGLLESALARAVNHFAYRPETRDRQHCLDRTP